MTKPKTTEPRPRLIEDYLPVREISAECVREKLGGHRLSPGHPRTLHLWWARRPLAACRAAVYATFAPPAAPKDRAKLRSFFAELTRWTGPVFVETEAIRKARSLVEKAADGKRPRVLDPFAGGGAIPLEALRLGCDAVAVELNPVAHLIERCTLEFPQKYGKKMRDAVKQWGEWVISRTQEELADLYPDIEVEGATAEVENLELFGGKGKRRGKGKKTLRPIAWLWTRTIPSPAPGYTGQVPLVRQTWLRRKKSGYVALRPVVDRKKQQVRFEMLTSQAKTEEAAIKEWGFDPAGLSVRGATTCPYSGTPVTTDHAKKAGMEGKLGVQLLAVVSVEPGARGKRYLPADADPLDPGELASRTTTRLEALKKAGLSVPDEQLPLDDNRNFWTPNYGLTTYGSLFSPRQQLLLLTICRNVREAHQKIATEDGDAGFAGAVAAYLALLAGRVADRSTTLCSWHNVGEKIEPTFGRQALPMVWDFAEANPFGGASGDSRLALDYILQVIDHAAAASPERPAELVRGRAQRTPVPDASIDAVVTDPPYYDNISYADLSDFYYVWQKRVLAGVYPDLYATTITPKKAEIIAAPHRHGDDKAAAASFYEQQMAEAFVECHRVLKSGAPMVVVYAHKTTLGWSTLVDSLRRAGFQVTEAWPLATEMPGRAGQRQTASLASSIFLVARKREAGGVGDYATQVRPEMIRIVETRVRELMEVGIGGADLVIAAVGAGLRPYTRYDSVELQSGDPLPADRFLEEIQREVLEAVLAAVFEVDRSGVGQVDQASRFYVLYRYQYGGAVVEFGEANILGKGVGVELTGPGSLSDGKRAVLKVEKGKVQLRGHDDRGNSEQLGLPSDNVSAPLVDVLHRLLWLVEHKPAEIATFLQQAAPDLARLRLLANALSGRALAGEGGADRTDEQKAIDRLLPQWKKLVEEPAGVQLALKG